MSDKIQSREWEDTDGSKLWVQRGWYKGKVVFTTDPEANQINRTVLLSREQVRELVKFLNYADE